MIQNAKIRKEKIYALLVDLKAAFDTIDREKLWDILISLGISNYLIEKIKGIYEETKVRIRTDFGVTEKFWTSKGLRQGCVLSPILFCLYSANLESDFKKRNVGGIKVGDKNLGIGLCR